METKSSRTWLGPIHLGLAFIALANAGCLAAVAGAGAAGGAAAGYFYFKGKVCQEYAATFEDTWSATRRALADLGMPVQKEDRKSSTSGTLESRTGANETVAIGIDSSSGPIPADGPLTRVCVRVGTFGDYSVSERILVQVEAQLTSKGLRLGPVVPAPSVNPSHQMIPPAAPTAAQPNPAPPIRQAGGVVQTNEPPLLTPK
jgi:hypothetical protein